MSEPRTSDQIRTDLSREAERIMSGFSGVVAMLVTQPEWPFRPPRRWMLGDSAMEMTRESMPGTEDAYRTRRGKGKPRAGGGLTSRRVSVVVVVGWRFIRDVVGD